MSLNSCCLVFVVSRTMSEGANACKTSTQDGRRDGFATQHFCIVAQITSFNPIDAPMLSGFWGRWPLATSKGIL